MNVRAVAVLLTVILASAVSASAAPGPSPKDVSAELAALTARVAKLEGTIVATDLVGTYSFIVVETTMRGTQATDPGLIKTSTNRALLTLNADGTGTGTSNPLGTPVCEKSELTLIGTMEGGDCTESGGILWTYADGVLTLTFLSDGDQIPFNVALGGRFFIQAFNAFHASGPSSNQVLFIGARLK